MNILCVSDQECPALWDYYQPGRLSDFDLILACGDLSSSYLSFLVTMARCPVLYVHGNHDGGYVQHPPEGCDCIDGQVVTYNGLRILGLGGCRQYRPGSHQYTDPEMRRRIRKVRSKLQRLQGVDIVVTHAPPLGLGDDNDPAHWGFAALRELLEEYHPPFLIHGHVHATYGCNRPREIEYKGTTIINAFERYSIQIPDPPCKEKERFQVIYKTRPPAHKEFI